MRKLQRCRALWGTDHRIAADPGLEFVAGAVYRPGPGEAGGLFDGARRLGTAGPPASPDGGSVEAAPEGVYLYVGPLILHYGHFMIETLSRLWPLLAWQAPGLRPRILCHGVPDPGLPEHAALYAMLAGLGVLPDDLVAFDRPVRLPLVLVPGQSMREREQVHAVFGRLCRTAGRRHWAETAVDAVERPVYLARTRLGGGVGRLTNEDRLVAELERHGVEIAHPQDLAFADQVRLLSSRRMILAPASSALHTTAFAAPGRRVVALHFALRLNANFPLFDAASGTRAYYYHAWHTEHGRAENFGLSWTLADPEGAARELVESAADFDRLDARDAAEEAAIARWARKPRVRFRIWRDGVATRLNTALDRALDGLRRPR